RASQIQYPGKFDINDKRGIDTFSDCTVLQATILGHGALWSDMFDTLVYDAPRQHPCDVLVDSFTGHAAAPSRKLFSYSRYWLGTAVVARIALGMAGISIKNYRSLLLILSWLALITLALAFFFSYGRVSFIFLPFFVSLGLGYGFLTMGQSIAHAPEFIVGLLLLSAYCLANVQQLSLCRRAVFYSILGR